MLKKINAAVADAYPLPEFITFIPLALHSPLLASDHERMRIQ